MLELFPLDGLRKAAETGALAMPDRALSSALQKQALIAAFMDGLASDSLARRKLPVDTASMWGECAIASAVPLKMTGALVPVLTADVKRDMTARITAAVHALGALDAVTGLCAGKATAATACAEKSALTKRWADRYGKPSVAYTGMRRLYVDETTSIDYNAREAVALAVEAHAFGVIRNLLGARAAAVVQFSDEPGRQSTGKKYGPQWKCFVYLAFKIDNC